MRHMGGVVYRPLNVTLDAQINHVIPLDPNSRSNTASPRVESDHVTEESANGLFVFLCARRDEEKKKPRSV